MDKEIFELLSKEAEFPYNYGKIDKIKKAIELNPSCGDIVIIYLKTNNNYNNIESIFFESKGCILSKAACSLLARYVEGKPLSFFINNSSEEILADLFLVNKIDLKLGINRLKCGLLPIMALKKGLVDA